MLDWLAPLLKLALYASTLVAAGSVLVERSLFLERRLQPRHFLRTVGAVLAVSALGSGGLILARLGTGLDVELAMAVLNGPVGLALLLSLAAGVAFSVGVTSVLELLVAFAAVLAFAVVGHAPATGTLGSITIAIHLAAAAWWTGGLLFLVRSESRMHLYEFAAVTRRFSNQAVWIVLGLLIAGAATAGQVLQFSLDLTRAYDRGLLTKLALVGGLLGLAVANRFFLAPFIDRDERALGRLRLAVRLELALVIGVLIVTSLITTVFPPD